MSVLDKFEVLEVPRTFSIAEVRILKNKISFNISAAAELGYPTFVRVFISHDKTQLALQPCDKITPNAMKFFTAEMAEKKKKRSVTLGNRALASLVKAGMGWDMEQVICAPGIRFSDENVIIFDLKQSYQKRRGVSTGSELCAVPTPAAPFNELPAQYFSNDAMPSKEERPAGQPQMIDATGEMKELA